jgi:hypothetical protein
MSTIEGHLVALTNLTVRMKTERDMLLTLVCRVYQEIDNVYDVDQPIDGPKKEYPFSGVGQLLARLREVMEYCGVKT